MRRWPQRRRAGRTWIPALASTTSLTALTSLAALISCAPPARRASPWRVPPAVADSVRSERLGDGVTLHRLVRTAGPLRAYVLDVDLRECVSVRSVKGAAATGAAATGAPATGAPATGAPVTGAPIAAGRQTTSALMLGLRPRFEPIAAVNADFFLFAPPGIPVGAHVEDGRLVSGPVARPVLAMLPTGAPWIGELHANVTIRAPTGRFGVNGWNRPTARTAGVVDAAWGVALDSTITGPVWRFVRVPSDSARYAVSLLGPADSRLARGDTLLGVSFGGLASILHAGDTVQVLRVMAPQVTHAVGGLPALLRDSMVVGAVDSVNDAGFRGVNPRTAVGIGANGRRLLLVVIDGRQAGLSVGASLRETASLLRDLGARDAINLDGGGSSAMVIADPGATSGFRLVNKPSDKTGERPVANALAVVRGCADAPRRSLGRGHVTRDG
jgi:hypothetical protein